MPKFVDTVEIDAQEALRIVGFQTFMRMLDTATSSLVQIGTAGGDIGFHTAASLASGTFIAAMTLKNSGGVDIVAQDALRVHGFQPFITLIDRENNGAVQARIQNAAGTINFFTGNSFTPGGKFTGLIPMVIHSSGDITMSGKLSVANDVVLTGGDCAEHFDAMPDAMCEPGTVMAINNGGALDASTKAYDKKVAGVVSGAGSLRPAILLDHQSSDTGRPAIALVGKVYCKVDADYAAIELGDLLTTSDTLGHAMKVSDPGKAFGAVIGKALRAVPSGRGLIPILIALQ